MDYGVVMFPTAYSIAPDDLARALEERGFESIWYPEHTHIPANRVSPWPGGPDLPREYRSNYDMFLALMLAGAASTRLKLGTGVCLVIERDPITPPRKWPPSIGCLVGACCSGLAAAGMPRRWRITALPGRRAGACCASACWR